MDFEALTKLPADARIKGLFAYFEDRRAHEAAGASSQPNVWEVFRYDEAMAVLSDHETFSSDKTALIPEDQKRLAQAARGNFIGVDPPLHTRMRSLVNKAFTPGVITRLEPRIRVLSDNLLDTVLGEAGPGDEVRFDLAQDFASQLSAAVIAELFGIPEADHKVFWTWSDGLIGSRPFGELGTVDEAAMRRIGELLTEASDYLMAHIADRRTDPRDDLTSTLARVEVEGRRLADDEIFGVIAMFLIAGHMSTSLMVGNTVTCLLEHPEALAEVRADPGLLPPAIEEVLRWRPALVRDQRVATVDTVLGGTEIPAGGNVCVWLASANRDERVFSDGARFDIHRDPNPHRAFGKGIHFCLGAPLARLESRIAVEGVLSRTRDITVVDGTVLHPSVGLIGPVQLPVTCRVADR
ncbi:cytochrome P450 [Streptomyces sp. ISL-12]|uniref:cytochrome P450 n=1 Tax=Streptomyces sp. ISL-12 TaxID=2819177 RepID=UPI001BEBCF77|nr:cytochrome P450 [Streptomyces sp. ISL-12]MBT2414375.1 cytochrome P450 [Streptomyces sp. ISL-12]